MEKNISAIQTPAILLDLNILERNISTYHQMAQEGTSLWPMIKTHKSTEIARIQLNQGATGLLCGTLDECEAVLENIVQGKSIFGDNMHGKNNGISIMYAYPVASQPNIARVVKLAQECKSFYLRLDNHQQAQVLNQAAAEAGIHINYTLIINSGLNRLGINPDELKNLIPKLTPLKHMRFCGISTHPGHAYSKTDPEDIAEIAQQESDTMKAAAEILINMGIPPKLITSGSTPTYPHIVQASTAATSINCLHPGNYVFMDNMQISMECAKEENCALTVLTTVIAAPRPGEFIIDAGTKCLGLDKSAHGNEKITGHGRIKGWGKNIGQGNLYHDLSHDSYTIYSLSEEVGKIVVSSNNNDAASLKIGDQLEIIPNHACAAANNTSYYIGMREGAFERLIHVDMRGNSTHKGVYI